MATIQPPKLIARNVAAVRRFADPSNLVSMTAGNPVSTRLESGIGNCFPGLECDLRNLERRFFPLLETDPIGNFIFLASVDTDGVARAEAVGDLSQTDASIYAGLADDLKAGRSVLVSQLTGTFGILGPLSLKLGLPALGQAPAVDGDLATPSAGAGRKPPDAWTAVRLLTEGTDVTLVFVNDGGPETLTLTAKRAPYLDDNGALSAAFLPGELSQSLCSPWTHDFRDCGCFYWASNHPDIAQPVLPTGAPAGQAWNAPVAWERRDRTIRPTPPAKATQAPSQPIELRHYEINSRWQELHFVVGLRWRSRRPFPRTPFRARLSVIEPSFWRTSTTRPGWNWLLRRNILRPRIRSNRIGIPRCRQIRICPAMLKRRALSSCASRSERCGIRVRSMT